MPSVARTRKRSLSVIGRTLTSGSADDSAVGCLKQRSPSERVIASPWYSRRDALLAPLGFVGAAIRHAPRTLRTKPPARSMRFFSSSLSGLWSSVTATACPARQSTARESPTWASTSRNAVPSFGFPWSSATRAVEPCWSNFFRSDKPRISLSVWLNASLMADLSFSSRDAGCTCFCLKWFMMFLCSCLAAWSATCVPPWPSKTAKSAASSGAPCSAAQQTTASSIDARQPCISQEAWPNQAPRPTRVVFSERRSICGWRLPPTSGTTSLATCLNKCVRQKKARSSSDQHCTTSQSAPRRTGNWPEADAGIQCAAAQISSRQP
mmetsp:Transcript_52467/g.149541  ORF Transcript_52467/g.149541 Transcript_52467/m.149541 type:complete len:323 (-) Transcript_52467:89-1057(-)